MNEEAEILNNYKFKKRYAKVHSGEKWEKKSGWTKKPNRKNHAWVKKQARKSRHKFGQK